MVGIGRDALMENDGCKNRPGSTNVSAEVDTPVGQIWHQCWRIVSLNLTSTPVTPMSGLDGEALGVELRVQEPLIRDKPTPGLTMHRQAADSIFFTMTRRPRCMRMPGRSRACSLACPEAAAQQFCVLQTRILPGAFCGSVKGLPAAEASPTRARPVGVGTHHKLLATLLWVFTRMAHWARHGLALALLALGLRLAVVPPLAPRRLALLAPALAAGPAGPAAAEVAISPRQAADLRISRSKWLLRQI